MRKETQVLICHGSSIQNIEDGEKRVFKQSKAEELSQKHIHET